MTRGQWNHAICDSCWRQLKADREPVRLREPQLETCCFCSKPTSSGIYVRFDPDDPQLQCRERNQ